MGILFNTGIDFVLKLQMNFKHDFVESIVTQKESIP